MSFKFDVSYLKSNGLIINAMNKSRRDRQTWTWASQTDFSTFLYVFVGEEQRRDDKYNFFQDLLIDRGYGKLIN